MDWKATMIIELIMCPTSNHQYVPVNGRLIKSSEMRSYDRQIDFLKLKYARKVDAFLEAVTDQSKIKIDFVFVFPEKKYFCKDGSLRKFDSYNRLKATADSIAKIIGIDDSLFIDGRVLKTYHNKDYETVFCKLSIIDKVPTLDEVLVE